MKSRTSSGMSKAVTKVGNQYEVGRETLNLSVRVGMYIQNNFEASDIFTLGNTTEDRFRASVKLIEVKYSERKREILMLEKEEIRFLEMLFNHANNFMDEVEEFANCIDAIELLADELYQLLYG